MGPVVAQGELLEAGNQGNGSDGNAGRNGHCGKEPGSRKSFAGSVKVGIQAGNQAATQAVVYPLLQAIRRRSASYQSQCFV
jgi:hypothetical protein